MPRAISGEVRTTAPVLVSRALVNEENDLNGMNLIPRASNEALDAFMVVKKIRFSARAAVRRKLVIAGRKMRVFRPNSEGILARNEVVGCQRKGAK